MQFRTELIIPESDRKITHSRKILGIGSCFVDSIGEKLDDAKFQVMRNPFGTLFHPLAIENALARIHSLTYYTQEEIFKYKDLYFSWDHHTSFSQPTMKSTLEKINTELELANEFMQNCDCFILTFGTSWVYKLKELGLFVANCHKVPNPNFQKNLLSDTQIKSSIKNSFNLIFDINPNAQIITTISPVRHTRDGIVENNISKSRLISNLCDVAMQYDHVDYFPSFEIMMDDLRDYRFYKEDLIHPNNMAIDYIWEKFSQTYFDGKTMDKIKVAQKIQSALAHRPMNTNTTSYKEFLYKTQKSIESVENDFPKDSFLTEKITLRKLMNDAN